MRSFKRVSSVTAAWAALAVVLSACGAPAQPTVKSTATASPALTHTTEPEKEISLADLKDVSAGNEYCLAVAQDGSVLTWGNYDGAILDVEYASGTGEPTVIDTGAVSVEAAADFCAEIKMDGSLWVWGKNKAVCGEAGAKAPVKVLDGVASVSLGGGFVLAVKTDGTLWAWGNDGFGQLCDAGEANAIPQPTKSVSVAMGDESIVPQPTKIMGGVKKAAAGVCFSLVLKQDGTLWGCGLNDCGQLLDFSNKKLETHLDTSKKEGIQTVPVKLMSGIADMAAGSYHSLALDTSGILWGFGDNSVGEIGNNWDAKNTILEPVYAGAQCRVPVKIMEGVKSFLASSGGSGAVTSDGSLWLWGGNGFGRVGDGTFRNALVPKMILDGVAFASQGGGYTMAVKTDGSFWAWGRNTDGELGLGYCNYQYRFVQVAEDVRQVVSNDRTTFIVKTDGSLWGAGSNDCGQFGDAKLPASPGFVQLMTGVQQADLGMNSAFCIKTDGTLWSWGNNLYGALGNGKLEEGKYAESEDYHAYSNHKLPKNYRERMTAPLVRHAPAKVLDGVRQVYADFCTAYAVRTDNTLWGWGMNESGYAFADKTSGNTAKPAAKIKDVQSMLGSGLVNKTDGWLYAWGLATLKYDAPKFMKTQISNVSSVHASWSSEVAVKTDGTLWAWGTFGTKKIDKPVQIDDHIRKVAGRNSVLLLKDDGTLYSLTGYDLDRIMEKADGTAEMHITADKEAEKVMDGVADMTEDKGTVSGGENGCCFAIKTDGTLWASGYNNYGELGDGKAVFAPKRVSR